ncbi:hybrid sensor histidine kinase/response regulator [Phaeobacter inhibens]|uniref:ATP-binding response regulator n=1 Tax=Phaeobacter inhibens TaxID=221822 RepID=UPI0001632C51|nr:ATP-binding protein [Phaeobacter inhibens]AFO91234.1 two-component system histidine kinase / response regulator [Phaeobacter inhibens DSM 17395]AUQ45892.1 two-component system histidine kinase / response regulator [Phaeobacter inhibens]AUQ66610.1 two-component system histidine kinase / response regulator [Phaeobacter inhibens]AXT22695.1 hybrid sensor histidine kinase/response regulator [Phaeobacter inhibens]UWR46622.1 response regulator [Phaeobacter inhibens]
MNGRHASPVPQLRVYTPEHARLAAVLLLSGMVITAPWLFQTPEWITRGLVAVGLTLIAVALMMLVQARTRLRARSMAAALLTGFIDKDATATFVCDDDGMIHASNGAALKRFADADTETLAGTLRSILANPSAVLFRLQSRARVDGAAREDIVTRRGHVRLAVHQMQGGSFLWRVEEITDRPTTSRGADAVPIPMLTVGRTGAVLFMNEAARSLIGERVKSTDRLFTSLPVLSGQINTMSTKSGLIEVLVCEKNRSQGRSELYFLQLADNETSVGQASLESLPVPFVKVDPKGTLLSANKLGMHLLGISSCGNLNIGQLMDGLGRPMSDWLRDTADGQASHKSEFLRLTRRDKEVFVQVTLTRVIEEGETVLIAVLNDATELKTLEAQFVQSQKMQAIGQLAGGVAHDFNNLLTAISGHCDLLLLRHDQGDQDFGDLIQIHENANRAAALVSQLLAFSRKQTLQPEVLDVRDTLSDLTHLLNRLVGEKVTLTLSHDPVMRSIRADKRQLEQVLMNLVVNARDAMPQGGEIRIETEAVVLDQPLERNRAVVPAGDWVTVKVSDEGVGISPDKLQKVFEPFYTTKRTGEGTGLGLSTAYGIIKQTGGYIFVDSIKDQGTQFTLFFPVNTQVEPEAAAAITVDATAKPVAAQHGEGVVLLVEDEAPVRAFASRALRMRGYTVLEAESAEDALRTLEDPGLTVDVFVTDVVMPGMDGPSWVREALKTRPDTRVVFVSGYAEGAFGEAEPSVPNSVFLPKPFSLNQLTETVHEQLH